LAGPHDVSFADVHVEIFDIPCSSHHHADYRDIGRWTLFG
jgi:hypothetical protein